MKLATTGYQRLAIRLRIADLQADVHRGSDESAPWEWVTLKSG